MTDSPALDMARRLVRDGCAAESRHRRGRGLVDSAGVPWESVWHVRLALGVARSSVYRAVREGRKLRGRTWRWAAGEARE